MIRLEELSLLTASSSQFSKRVKAAALVFATGVPWTAPAFGEASDEEKASRMLLGGGDAFRTVYRCAVKVRSQGFSITGTSDASISDSDLLNMVTESIVEDMVGQ